MKIGRFAVAVSWAAVLCNHAAAQTPEQFYRGKFVDMVIGYPPGGSNDIWGRLLARHLGKHIPGSPNVVPKNTPGAGSFLAINQVYTTLPKDGTIVAIGAPTAVLDERLGSQGVRFKSSELNWIGRIDPNVNLTFMWHSAPVKTFADALWHEATLSGTGAGSTVSVLPTVMNNVFKTKFKLIMGYRGSNDAMLALERGEVEGHSTSWVALKVAHADWVRDKKVSFLVQYSLSRHPELAGVPTAVELGRSEEERTILGTIMASADIGSAFFTTPGVPADRLTVLRRAFDATMKDPAFLDDVQRSTLAVGPMTGEDLQKLVAQVINLSPDLLEKVRAAYLSNQH
jgi:tripartite-type tricarboxylate transporter receptor subunit TctC